MDLALEGQDRRELDLPARPFDTIEASTLLLAGFETSPNLTETTRRAAGSVPAARIRVVDDHGHMAYMSDLILVADRIRTFASTWVWA